MHLGILGILTAVLAQDDASIRSGDPSEIEEIVKRVRGKNYGLRSRIHEIVQSRLFREK